MLKLSAADLRDLSRLEYSLCKGIETLMNACWCPWGPSGWGQRRAGNFASCHLYSHSWKDQLSGRYLFPE